MKLMRRRSFIIITLFRSMRWATSSAVHFYAMQLIEGRSLAEVIRYLRAAVGKDTRSDRGLSLTRPVIERPSSEPLTVMPGSGARPLAAESIRIPGRFLPS